MPNLRSVNQTRTILLASDDKNSIHAELVGGQRNFIAYAPYGHQAAQQEVASRLGFNGELCERIFGWYLLGNGYRAYNPILMRFHNPDSWSPFGKGGLNAYMYCGGDPRNFTDPTGHLRLPRLLRNTRPRTTSPTRPDIATLANARAVEARGVEALRSNGTPVPPSGNEYFTSPAASSSVAPTHAPAPRPRSSTPPPPLPPRRRPEPTTSPELIPFPDYIAAETSNSPLTNVLASSPAPPVNRTNKPRPPSTWLSGRERFNLVPKSPPVPDRLLPDNTMRRADGSTYFDLDAAIKQLRGSDRF